MLSDVEENLKIFLNLKERFLLINVIGGVLSKRDTLLDYILILDQLNVTNVEVSNTDLDIRYDESTMQVIWNDEYDIPKEISFKETLLKDLLDQLSLIDLASATEVRNKLAGIHH